MQNKKRLAMTTALSGILMTGALGGAAQAQAFPRDYDRGAHERSGYSSGYYGGDPYRPDGPADRWHDRENGNGQGYRDGGYDPDRSWNRDRRDYDHDRNWRDSRRERSAAVIGGSAATGAIIGGIAGGGKGAGIGAVAGAAAGFLFDRMHRKRSDWR